MKTLLLLGLSAPVLFAALDRSVDEPAMLGANQPPVCCFGPDCQQTGLIVTLPCAGSETTYQLDASGSYDPEGQPLTFFWQSCPGSTIDDPTAPITTLRIDTSSNCDQTCSVRLFVTDGRDASYCRLHVVVTPELEGCTPGYWKNHPESWGPTGFNPTDDFDTVFGVDAFDPNISLMDALWLGGGGLNKLARHGTAALLNASYSDLNFPLSQSEVIDQVQAAILSGTYEPLASRLARANEAGCPLN